MKSYHSVGIIFLLSALMLSGCVNNELEELENNEKKIIEKYLADNQISPDSKTEGGIYLIEKSAGTGLSPVKDNYVIINYTGRYLEDGAIRETSYDSLKSQWPMAGKLDNYLFGPVKILYGYSMPGINEALSLMKEGGEATAVIPSDKAFYDYKPLLYDLELLKVIRDPEAYEDSIISVYVEKFYGEDSQIDSLGIWTHVTEFSESENVFEPGDTLYFNFTARIVDGYGESVVTDRIFDSNSGSNPIRYLHGQTRPESGDMMLNQQNNLPNGLRIALGEILINNGMKFSVLLRYDQAFGATGLQHSKDKYIIVPVYQTVVYNLEVTAIRPE